MSMAEQLRDYADDVRTSAGLHQTLHAAANLLEDANGLITRIYFQDHVGHHALDSWKERYDR